MTSKRAIWRRDIALYGSIAFLGAWQSFRFETTREALMSSTLAGLIGIKAKLSNGKPDLKPTEVQVVNAPSDPVPTTEAG